MIKADGVGTIVHIDEHGRRDVISVRAWFGNQDGYYRWSRAKFGAEKQAREYGAKVADRFNRIFGQEAVKDVQTA